MENETCERKAETEATAEPTPEQKAEWGKQFNKVLEDTAKLYYQIKDLFDQCQAARADGFKVNLVNAEMAMTFALRANRDYCAQKYEGVQQCIDKAIEYFRAFQKDLEQANYNRKADALRAAA